MEYNQQDNKSIVVDSGRLVISDDVYHALCHIMHRNDLDFPDCLYTHGEITQERIFNNIIRAVIYKCGFGKYLNCPTFETEEERAEVKLSKCYRMFGEDKHAIASRRYWNAE